MASTLKINNLDTASGSTITIPTGKQLIGTDTNSIKAPGMIVQVVSGQLDTQLTLSTNKTVKTNTGLFVTITPKYSNSKLFVQATGNTYSSHYNDNPLHYIIRTVSGTATSIGATDYMTYSQNDSGGQGGAYVQSVMDTAQSTAAHEYKIQIRSDSDGGTVYFNVRDSAGGIGDEAQRSTIMVMEIAQ